MSPRLCGRFFCSLDSYFAQFVLLARIPLVLVSCRPWSRINYPPLLVGPAFALHLVFWGPDLTSGVEGSGSTTSESFLVRTTKENFLFGLQVPEWLTSQNSTFILQRQWEDFSESSYPFGTRGLKALVRFPRNQKEIFLEASARKPCIPWNSRGVQRPIEGSKIRKGGPCVREAVPSRREGSWDPFIIQETIGTGKTRASRALRKTSRGADRTTTKRQRERERERGSRKRERERVKRGETEGEGDSRREGPDT